MRKHQLLLSYQLDRRLNNGNLYCLGRFCDDKVIFQAVGNVLGHRNLDRDAENNEKEKKRTFEEFQHISIHKM